MINNSEPLIPSDKVMDVRPVPYSTKHHLILQTWRNLRIGDYFVVLNDQDPVPLYYQFCDEWPGMFRWEHLAKGPDKYSVRITKLADVP